MEYSASRDPAKLTDTAQTDGSFKVGNREYEQQIQDGINNQKWPDKPYLILLSLKFRAKNLSRDWRFLIEDIKNFKLI